MLATRSLSTVTMLAPTQPSSLDGTRMIVALSTVARTSGATRSTLGLPTTLSKDDALTTLISR